MKSVVCIMIFLFVTFLSLPTVLGIIDNNETDMSMIYNMSEEEEVHKTYNIKEALKTNKQVFQISFELPFEKKIVLENHIQYDTVFEEIFSPPPELL
ncbi:hypothetical protein H9X57_02110 [Flavobacterium piscinae]|nr:hypothetical protein [Flavobacterium piscinae]MBC8882631.1 hypothetical protein [Flavobacterium piscinae]